MTDQPTNGTERSYSVEDQVPVLNALLNGVLQGTVKPDAAKAVITVLRHPIDGIEVAIKAHRAGLTLASGMSRALGLNGTAAALPNPDDTAHEAPQD